MDDKRLQKIIIVILCLVLIRGLIYGLFIPFDRAPDENYYFNLIKAKQLQISHTFGEKQQHVAAQMELTRYYLLHPEANPQKYSLQDFAEAELSDPPPSREIYYLFMAWILKTLSLENIRDEIYVIRGISVLCGMIVVLFSFLVVRELFPENFFLLTGVPVFIAFIPQFSAMNGAINTDKFAEVFAALLFWLIVRIFKYRRGRIYLPACILTIGLALLSKRTTMFLLPLFLIFLFVYYWKSTFGLWMHLVLFALFIGIAIGQHYLAWYAEKTEWVLKDYLIWLPPHKIRLLLSEFLSPDSLKYCAKFFTVIYWSFWGVFGYMRIHLHHFWYVLTASIQFLSICGLLKSVLHVKMKKLFIERWKVKTYYVFAISIILVVLVMFLRSVVFRFEDPVLAQGRRLFTVIIPISVLMMFGLEGLIHSRYHRLVGAIGIIGLLILDVVCLSNYILLNFYGRSLF
jgi:4-amino-4-deoxy-L-arabinose transferase-like glycosyltransferase